MFSAKLYFLLQKYKICSYQTSFVNGQQDSIFKSQTTTLCIFKSNLHHLCQKLNQVLFQVICDQIMYILQFYGENLFICLDYITILLLCIEDAIRYQKNLLELEKVSDLQFEGKYQLKVRC